MELEEKYKVLLLKIHDSENERILQSEWSDDESLQASISHLIQLDLVEFDKKDVAYYLTYDGYTKVEQIKALIKDGEATEHLAFENAKKREKKNRTLWLVLGVFVFFCGYLAMYGTKPTMPLEEAVDQKILEQMKEEIKTKTDSILNLKE